MATNRVRTGSEYYFNPVAMDRFDPKTDLMKGDRVKVVNLRGCPPANTMGHAHVTKNGQFAGLVHCNSLSKENHVLTLDEEEDQDWNKLILAGVMKPIN